MDKNSAIQLIENTFNDKFDENQFTLFIKNFLNDIEQGDKVKTWSGNYLWDDYKEHINTYKRIGKYIDPEGDALDVLIVQVKSVTKLQKARTTLRNFVNKHLRKFEKDYALVAFYSKEDEGADWRFSFIKLEHQSYLDEEKQKVKTREEVTPAKRYSFLVGEYEDSHTAKNQLLPLLQNIANNPTLEELETAFSIEKVTDEFFGQYKDLFIKLSSHFDNDEHIKAELKNANIDNSRFTKKLLGQIVFLYFLQKKGWLGVPEKETWGKGDKRFLQDLFTKADDNNKNYFNDYLQPLFYEALAKERNNENSYYEKFYCRIPFLNGGLFEAEYNWQKANISIPEYLFRNEDKNKAGDIGTGVLDVFDRYNFTIKEDEPLDKEVAVDPEMLGKVFENMLDITERKSKGAFYTPREIVHYMCQESLIHYLDNSLENRIKKADIETYIRNGHFALEHDQRVANKGETKTYKYIISESIRQNAELIDQKLSEIKILDPAIGSGAFPVGLLHELVNAQLVLKPHLSKKYTQAKLVDFGFNANETDISESRYVYRLKRHIIQESIYGVDIDASAIDIARLRLWLSLVVDEDDFDPIETLPNLDYKIVCGNSLISRYDINMPIEEVFKEFNKDRDDKMDLDKYKALVNAFMDESDHDKKEEFRTLIAEIKSAFKTYFSQDEKLKLDKLKLKLNDLDNNLFSETKSSAEKKRIKELKATITKKEKERNDIEQAKIYENAIEWRFEFPNLLNENGGFIGFDVVIGNPPYVEHKKLKHIASHLKPIYDVYSGSADLSVYFFERGTKLLRDSGTLSYINTNKFFNTGYGKYLREYLLKYHINFIVNFEQVEIFDKVLVSSLILNTSKKSIDENHKFDYVEFYKEKNWRKDFEQRVFNKREQFNQSMFSSSEWVFLDDMGLRIKNQIEDNSTLLKDIIGIDIKRGVTTGFDPAFIVNNEQTEHLSDDIIKPLLKGREIKKYKHRPSLLKIIFTRRGIDIDKHENVKKHLYDFIQELTPREKAGDIGRKPGSYNWYEIQDNTAYYPLFDMQKIIWPLTADKWGFALDREMHYLTSGGFLLVSETVSLKYLLAILNSTLQEYYFKFIGVMTAGGAYTLKKATIEYLPIKLTDDITVFEILVDYVIYLREIDNDLLYSFFDNLIDGIVYELYFPEELKSANKEILKHLGDLKPIADEMSEEEKLAIIQSEFERLYDPNHPVRNNIETLDSIEEVRIIKESLNH